MRGPKPKIKICKIFDENLNKFSEKLKLKLYDFIYLDTDEI